MKNGTNRYTTNLRMSALENACIIMVKREFGRTSSGKCWKGKPVDETTEKVTAEQYYNYCNSIPFFKNLVKGTLGSETCDFGYTYAGYVPTEIRSVAPDRSKKIVRRFYIVDNEDTARNIYKLAI